MKTLFMHTPLHVRVYLTECLLKGIHIYSSHNDILVETKELIMHQLSDSMAIRNLISPSMRNIYASSCTPTFQFKIPRGLYLLELCLP